MDQVIIYADAVCSQKGNVCGYGIYCEEPHTRIGEPLPGIVQRREKAQLRAMHAAMEFAHGIRAREITLYLPSKPLVHYFNHMLHRWVAKDFRYRKTRVPHHALWRQIHQLAVEMSDRGVAMELIYASRREDEKMREAFNLALLGTRMHVVCALCQTPHGRQFRSHDCHPICNFDHCRKKKFSDVMSYRQHLDLWHRRDCPSLDCEEDMGMYSDRELRRHLREVHGAAAGCEFCGRLFSCPNRCRRHIMKCPEAERCRDCGLRFFTRREANIHREMDQKGEEYEDDEYGSETSSSTSSDSSTSTSSFSDEMLTLATARYR